MKVWTGTLYFHIKVPTILSSCHQSFVQILTIGYRIFMARYRYAHGWAFLRWNLLNFLQSIVDSIINSILRAICQRKQQFEVFESWRSAENWHNTKGKDYYIRPSILIRFKLIVQLINNNVLHALQTIIRLKTQYSPSFDPLWPHTLLILLL